jgi:uncharacterized protein YdeI (YjbR/CyaY-like superfamily)
MKTRPNRKTAAPRELRLTRALQPMPAFVRRALTQRGLAAAYRARPPYQQNDYLAWINRAAREETKQERLAQMLDELAGGTRYMRMAWRPARPAR